MIKSKNWNGVECILKFENGELVTVNTTVPDASGAILRVTGGRAPHKSTSSGKVYMSNNCQYFPHVFGMQWVENE